MVKNQLAKARDVDSSLAQEDPLQKEMAHHCSILACEIRMARGAWWATVCGIAKELDMQ